MANRYGWGDNEPKILPGAQGGDRTNFFGIKIKALFTDLFAKLNVDANKLNGIQPGAEVNQNAFAKVKVGSAVVEADQKQDTLELVPGSNVTITPDAVNDKVTIAVNGDFLPLSGGTISGNINAKTTYNDGSGNTVIGPLIRLGTTNTPYGNHIAVGGGSSIVVGGGEAVAAQLNELIGQDSEDAYIVADRKVIIKTNGNTWANAKTIEFGADGALTVSKVNGDLNGNAASATKLQTSRRINGVLFNGTGDITITAAANGGTSAACSGNAATATRLQTGRTINGVPFDGTGNINISAPANGGTSAACSGNAASATRLQTARKINNVPFNGASDIAVTDLYTKITNCFRLRSGWQICYGVAQLLSGASGDTITFPLPFNAEPNVQASIVNSSVALGIPTVTQTSATFVTSSNNVYIRWMAVGSWS